MCPDAANATEVYTVYKPNKGHHILSIKKNIRKNPPVPTAECVTPLPAAPATLPTVAELYVRPKAADASEVRKLVHKQRDCLQDTICSENSSGGEALHRHLASSVL